MALVSLQFIFFCALIGAVYYLVPGKLQNIVLLAANIVFILDYSGTRQSLIFMFGAIILTYGAGLLIEKNDDIKIRKLILWSTIIINIVLLIWFKYQNFFINIRNDLTSKKPWAEASIIAPLGISFYTLMLIGYLVDVYWGTIGAERNLINFIVYGSYFPQITSGPVSKFSDLGERLKVRRSFSYKNVTFGLQRMTWGFFKKLVISERAAIPVNTVFANYQVYSGFYIVFAVLMFALQLYTDFSGCMDIVIGMSEVLGIRLPENFRTPFYSLTVNEFWRRWHITLGGWFRDYLFYPLQKTKFISNLRKRTKKLFGKKASKMIPMYLSMLILWFLIGFWHGGLWKYIVGSGLLPFAFMVLGQELRPVFDFFVRVLHIDVNSFGHRLFCRLRTLLLVCAGFVFFRAPSFHTALKMYKAIGTWNMSILSFDNLLSLGLDLKDILVLVVAFALLMLVGFYQQKGSVREMIAEQNIIFRFIVYIGLFYAVVIFGMYGPDFNAASFIYAGF